MKTMDLEGKPGRVEGGNTPRSPRPVRVSSSLSPGGSIRELVRALPVFALAVALSVVAPACAPEQGALGDLGTPVPADDDDAAPDDDDAAPDDDDAAPDDDDAGPAPYACMYSVTSDDIPEAPDRDGGDHECRFWSIVTDAAPASVIDDHLVLLPNAVKSLGESNDNGWAVAYYPSDGAAPQMVRGTPPAAEDAAFDAAAALAGGETPAIAMSHVRNCSSGLCDIDNPHPFERVARGRHWLMGHNGTIDKEMLRGLVGDAYLEAHPPNIGDGFEEWIDSELYFLLMLKTIDEYQGQVESALESVIQQLHAGGAPVQGLNFMLSDGETVWAYRDGESLYLFYDDTVAPCSVVASQYPTASLGNWTTVGEGDLLTLRTNAPPMVTPISTD